MRKSDLVPARALAIDDSPEVLALLQVRLKPEGIKLFTASTFDEGLAMAMELLPDLILLDVDIPKHSGLDLCRRLKEEGATSAIPIIFLTGSSDIGRSTPSPASATAHTSTIDCSWRWRRACACSDRSRSCCSISITSSA